MMTQHATNVAKTGDTREEPCVAEVAQEMWKHKYSYIMWWIILRYFTIFLEYLAGWHLISRLSHPFPPVLLGSLMIASACVGLWALACKNRCNRKLSYHLAQTFTVLVILHSFMRIEVMLLNHVMIATGLMLLILDILLMSITLHRITLKKRCPR